MTAELEKLQHRVDLILPKVQSLKTADVHGRDSYIYILKHSLAALNEDRKPLVWSLGMSNERLVADIEGLNRFLDRAERFLVAHTRRLK